MSDHDFIYLDHAATTPCLNLPQTEKTASKSFANPSSPHSVGREARKVLEKARRTIAKCIGAKPNEIYFTSGGTESDNWALKGVAFRSRPGSRIIVSSIEHHAVLETCKFLERLGYDIVRLPVDSEGLISVEDLEAAINDNTVLVSIMTVNNEIGTIEPIQALCEAAHKHNVLFHTDAVQAVGKLHVDVQGTGVDLLSASAHKFNGPKGTGFLYIKEGTDIEPLIHGGSQENGMRAGTENVENIIAMAEMLDHHTQYMDRNMSYIESLETALHCFLTNRHIPFRVLGAERHHMPGVLSLVFPDIDGQDLMYYLDAKKIAVSTGAACNSKETKQSHVLEAIGAPATHAIRVSFGVENDPWAVDAIVNAIEKLYRAKIESHQ